MSLEHFECKKGTSNSVYFLHMMSEFMSVLVSSMVTVIPEVRGKVIVRILVQFCGKTG
jgi:hypothetical protein